MAINFPANPDVGEIYTSGENSWQWDGVAWNIISSQASNFAYKNFSADQGSTTADSPDDTLRILGGANIDTSISGDTVTVSFSGTGPDLQNVFTTINGDSGTAITPSSPTTALNFEGGNGIEVSTTAASNTINVSYTGQSIPFTNLTDVQQASLSVAKIYEPAIVMFRVDNVGTSSYTFSPHYSGGNPTIFVIAGTTVAFDLTAAGGHPFEIQDPLGDPFNTGLLHVTDAGIVSTGANAQGKDNGVLYWRIPENISGGYRYQCQNHAAMVGAITVKRISVL